MWVNLIVLLYIYAIAIGSLYFSKTINVLTTILSVIGVSLGQIICYVFTIFQDKNFTTFYKLIVYGILPRAMVLIAIAAIFTMLCERTAGMLSNLMNAEEQEQMIQNIKAMHKKSQETSRALMDMVQELSEITESSTKSNEQIVRETGMCSIREVGDSTAMITGANEQMTRQIMEMDKTVEDIKIHSSEVASSMEQVNANTQSNYQAIEHVTAATQENSAGAKAIEDMVVRIRTLAMEPERKDA